ncbi:MAG TPA: ATP-binding protein [Ktedonobacteraceae bacterium]
MGVEQHYEQKITAPAILSALLTEFSAISDCHTLQENVPRRLADLLNCRCVLLYMRIGETLQFTAGSFDDTPGWSASLLAVAHINPIRLNSDLPEARAWSTRQVIAEPAESPTLLAAPLLYRQRAIGVLLALCGEEEGQDGVLVWQKADRELLEAIAGVVALLLENTRLLERDRERIHELSLLNSISSQMNYSLYELERMRRVVLQRTREIATTDVCALLEPDIEPPEWISAQLQALLFQRFSEQHSLLPLIIERPGDGNLRTSEYVHQLPVTLRTFFAVPLLSGRALGKRNGSLIRNVREPSHELEVLGVIVGGYHRNRKLFREELVLLQVLASQAGAVLENMHLMTEVVEARNEARKLLHQVLDDQHFKELILESIPSGLITTDQKGNITTFNRAAESILGYHPYEVVGQPLLLLLDLPSSAVLKQHWELLLSRMPDVPGQTASRGAHELEVCSGVILGTDREGRELVLDVAILPLYGGHAEPIGTLVTFTDVTSMHRLEEEKRRLDRLASLGEMAANVAHEVRNPLASIKTSMQMLIDDLGSSLLTDGQVGDVALAEAQESVSVVLKEVERLDMLVRELLLFARPHQLQRVKCNVGALSDHVLQLLQHQCAEASITVQRVYSPVPPLYADLGQLEQILLNLYMNAVQAMPDGGVLTISCRSRSSEEAINDGEHAASLQRRQSTVLIQRYNERREWPVKEWLEIAVRDTGVGIPEDQLERIFQPFFTTKAHGIGLGLAITRRLVEDHGGYILVEGQIGLGATIIVRLPLITPENLLVQEDELKERGEGGER